MTMSLLLVRGIGAHGGQRVRVHGPIEAEDAPVSSRTRASDSARTKYYFTVAAPAPR